MRACAPPSRLDSLPSGSRGLCLSLNSPRQWEKLIFSKPMFFNFSSRGIRGNSPLSFSTRSITLKRGDNIDNVRSFLGRIRCLENENCLYRMGYDVRFIELSIYRRMNNICIIIHGNNICRNDILRKEKNSKI